MSFDRKHDGALAPPALELDAAGDEPREQVSARAAHIVTSARVGRGRAEAGGGSTRLFHVHIENNFQIHVNTVVCALPLDVPTNESDYQNPER